LEVLQVGPGNPVSETGNRISERGRMGKKSGPMRLGGQHLEGPEEGVRVRVRMRGRGLEGMGRGLEGMRRGLEGVRGGLEGVRVGLEGRGGLVQMLEEEIIQCGSSNSLQVQVYN
jgi:hypothetical protein